MITPREWEAPAEAEWEVERYELANAPELFRGLDRRSFLQGAAGGLLVLFLLKDAEAQESGGRSRGGRGGELPQEIGAWLRIDEDGKVTACTGKVEVGQNARTSLSQVVAEELRVPVSSVHLVMADTELTPYDMGTFGSRTTPTMAPVLRRVAAAARELLLDEAAKQWNVDRSHVSVTDGTLRSDTGQVIRYGELTHGKRLTQAVSGNPPTTPAEAWKVEGHSVPKAEARALVTGEHRYTSDLKLPGMLYGKVVRPPAIGSKVASVDTKTAEALPGVVAVHEGEFIGIAAPTSALASEAAKRVRAQWNETPQPSDTELYALLRKGAGEVRHVPESAGSGGLWRKETYQVAYIAHAPLEPRAAVAHWEDGKLTVWTGTQRPFGVRSELAAAFNVPENRVRVITPDTGAAYGGKHTGEAAVEAARLARAAGKPVKLVWTREEEFTWGYLRPAGVIEISSAVRADGTLAGWAQHNFNSGPSAIRSPYDVPGQIAEFHPASSPLRQGSYRGLAATANNFARESHMDELAHAQKADPLDFRLKNLKDERLRAVLLAAAKAFGWSQRPASGNGRGFGIACGTEKGSYLATCAEVEADAMGKELRVVRAVSAFECGAVLNPNQLQAQVSGALIMGIGGALWESIGFEGGKLRNPRFSKYRMPRLRDVPEIEVVLVDRKDLPSAGAGETPIIGIAPALGNALFAATGIRRRNLPLLSG